MPIKRRRVMKEFKITEISAVDKPAVAGALATLIKRDTRPAAGLEEFTKQESGLEGFTKQWLHHAALPAPRQKETTAMTIRKHSDDALASMNNYIAKRDRGVSRATSAEQWRKLHPAEFEALNRVGPSTPAPVAKRSASVDFMKLVDDVRRERDCDRTTAMEIARRVHKDAFEKFQAASA